jgi:hypothetical protein
MAPMLPDASTSDAIFSILPFLILIAFWAFLMRYSRRMRPRQENLDEKLDEIRDEIRRLRETIEQRRF